MFEEFFSSISGPTAPEDTHYTRNDKCYLLVQAHPFYPGVFYAVGAENDQDRVVFGKPVVMIPHALTLQKLREKREIDKRVVRQNTLLKAARQSLGKVELTGTMMRVLVPAWDILASPEKFKPGTYPTPHGPCNPECPAGWFSKWDRPFRTGSNSLPVEDGLLLQSMCAGHRDMVENFLKTNPDAWPPKQSV